MSKVLVDVPDDELDQFECRTSEYFESGSELGYEFLNSFGVAYKSDATYESGYWWFDRFYKCVSVRCRKVSSLNSGLRHDLKQGNNKSDHSNHNQATDRMQPRISHIHTDIKTK